jgi:hypothetical protein
MKHKFLILITAACMYSVNLLGQCTDFVTVDGKKLKCGGSDYFSVAINYVVEVMHACGTTTASPYTIQNHYPSRAHMYSPDNTFDPEITNRTQAFNAMLKDFTDMKNQGFNTIRVAGAGYQDIESKDCTETYNYFINYSDPAFNQLLLDIHTDIIKAASQAGIKVVMIMGEIKFVAPYPWYSDTIHAAPPTAQTNGYINYLKLFSAKFKNDPTVLAIDFINEPDLYNRENKTALCQLTKTWNDAVKSKSDILTTIGLWSYHPFSWDANMLNIDFASFHNYPYVVDSANLSDLPAAINRIKSDYWWFKNNLNIPWVVGETGLAAHPKNITHPINTTGNWTPWHISGTLTDQADYLAGTLFASRDFGGSGYSWWTFMDEHAGTTPYNTPSTGPFWGLAYSNEGNTTTGWKPGVSYITSFNSSSASSPTQPGNYYNYFNTPNTGKYAYGNVQTTGNVPVKDAIIEVAGINSRTYVTYTDANGNYTVYSPADMVSIKITATECNQYVETFGGLSVVHRNVQLTKIDRVISGTLNYANQTVTGVNVNEHADTYATFTNYTIAYSDFNVTAFSYIRLNPGTYIYPDNNFSATIGNFYHDCGTIVNSNNVAFREGTAEPDSAGEVAYSVIDKRAINEETVTDESKLDKNKNFKVYPSPSNGEFIVSTVSKNEKQLTVINNLGVVVYRDKFSGVEHYLNLNLASGVYFVEVTDNLGKAQKKIIIEK